MVVRFVLAVEFADVEQVLVLCPGECRPLVDNCFAIRIRTFPFDHWPVLGKIEDDSTNL